MSDPRRLRNWGLALVVGGALLAGLGDGLRESAGAGDANWTFLLDVVGLFLVLGGAVFEARSADIMFESAPSETRARARILLIAAVPAVFVPLASLGSIDRPLMRGLAGSVLMLGIGFGLGGLFSLAWIHGGGYAADRIQDRVDDDSR